MCSPFQILAEIMAITKQYLSYVNVIIIYDRLQHVYYRVLFYFYFRLATNDLLQVYTSCDNIIQFGTIRIV